MQIIVRSDRTTITLEVAVTDRVEELKAKISDRLGCRIDQQQLYFENVILEDLKCLLDYSLGPECELSLEIRMKIIVKMRNTQMELDCYPSMNITEVKHEISKRIPIQPNNQVLTYEERELKNTQTLRDCKFKEHAFIILTGIIMVSVTLSSGRNISLLLEQSSHVFAIKEEIQRKECIPSPLLTLNYKGRVLREDQTFASIHYREDEIISLVVQQSDCDKMNIFVNKPNGQKQLISINKYDPIGKIEDTVFSDVDSFFSHFCLYNDKKLDDMDVLNMHRIQPMSEVELRSIDNRISVFVTLLNGSVTSFYIQPMELVLEVKSRIKSKLGTDNAHKNLFHKHKKLANDQTMRECEILPGAHLLFGSEESFSVTIHPGFKSFEILAQKNDTIKDLKTRIQNKGRIPIEFQMMYFEGRELQDARFVNTFTIECGSIISLAILSDLGIPISLNLVDLAGNFKYISGVGVYITVENFIQNLSNILPINKQDSLAFQGIIMEPARLLCSYEISNDSEVQIVSINNPGILSHIKTRRNTVIPANTSQAPVGQTTVAHVYAQNPRQRHQHPSQNLQQSMPTYHQPNQNPPDPTNVYNQPTNPQQLTHTHYQQGPPSAQVYTTTSQPLHNLQAVPNPYTIHNPDDTNSPQPIPNPQAVSTPYAVSNLQPVPNPLATLNPQHSYQKFTYRQDAQESRVVDQHFKQSDNISASRPQPHMGRQQSAPMLPSAREIFMLVMHPVTGTFSIPCTSNQTIFNLKKSISQKINIPHGKIQLLYDDQLLSQDTVTLGEYGIYKDRIIKLNDLLCININFESKKFVKWMNGYDLVSSLATELAEYMSVQQENIQLRCENGKMDFSKRLSSYLALDSPTGVLVELF